MQLDFSRAFPVRHLFLFAGVVFLLVSTIHPGARDVRKLDRLFGLIFGFELLCVGVSVTVFFAFLAQGSVDIPSFPEFYTPSTYRLLLAQTFARFALSALVVLGFAASQRWAKWALLAHVLAVGVLTRFSAIEPDSPAYFEMMDRFNCPTAPAALDTDQTDDVEVYTVECEVWYPEYLTYGLYAIALMYAFWVREKTATESDVPATRSSPLLPDA